MKYKVNDRVRIKSLDWYYDNRDRIDEVTCGNTNFIPDMVKYCEEIVTISSVLPTLEVYHIKEDGGMFNWTDEMIEGLVEEETKPKYEDEVNGEYYSTPKYLVRPNSYQFVDENGNVINAQKIVLEKKKKEYPNHFYHCVRTLGLYSHPADASRYKTELIRKLQTLLICRDAYWKIAGKEMGLGSPWKPDWLDDDVVKHIISHDGKTYGTRGGLNYINYILAFPTEEMRDAFYENFKELIESVKELL